MKQANSGVKIPPKIYLTPVFGRLYVELLYLQYLTKTSEIPLCFQDGYGGYPDLRSAAHGQSGLRHSDAVIVGKTRVEIKKRYPTRLNDMIIQI